MVNVELIFFNDLCETVCMEHLFFVGHIYLSYFVATSTPVLNF